MDQFYEISEKKVKFVKRLRGTKKKEELTKQFWSMLQLQRNDIF